MEDKPASQQIDDIIKLHSGWKATVLSQLRAVIKAADQDIIEEVKWKMPSRPEGLPVWSRDGIVCLTEIFKNDIKLVFFKGAQMDDPKKLFNARLKSSTERAIEFREDSQVVDEAALTELVQAAVQINILKAKK